MKIISVESGWTRPSVDPIRVRSDPTLTIKCMGFFRVGLQIFFIRSGSGLVKPDPDPTFCYPYLKSFINTYILLNYYLYHMKRPYYLSDVIIFKQKLTVW